MAVVVPGTIPSLPVAFDVQGDDLVLIYQPGQTPSTRAAKVSDVGGVPSTNPVFSGTVTADGVATANVSGTDGLTVNGGSNGVTVAGGPLVIPTIGRLLVGDGATTTAGGSLGHLQFNQINLAGTITDTAATLNNFAVPSDTADASSAPNTPAYLGVNANFGGVGFGGGRAGFRVQMTQTGDIGSGALTGANFWMNGGGHAAPNAQFYSGNFQTQIAPDTTGIGVVLGGGEINVQIGAGSTTASKAMLTLIQEEGDAVQGTNYDTALGFSNQGGAVGWDNILSVGRPDGVPPMRPDGTIFGAYLQTAWGDAGRTHQFPALATGIGIDWSLINFSKANGYFLRGPGGFSATGKGEVTAGNAIFGPTASGVQIDIPNQIVTAVAVANGGGGGGSGTNDYYAGDIFYDGLGGQYEATGVTAGAVTAVSILAAGVSASPPANPVTVTGGSGTGLTLTLTWAANGTLSLNPSGGATTVGGSLAMGAGLLSGTNVTFGSNATAPTFIANGPSGVSRFLTYNTAGVRRFEAGLTNGAETGANAGSDYRINCYSDSGTFIASPFTITRATGVVNAAVGFAAPQFNSTNASIGLGSGTQSSKAPLYCNTFFNGATSTINGQHAILINDQVAYSGTDNLDGLQVFNSIGGGSFSGNRTTIHSRVLLSGAAVSPTFATAYVSNYAEAVATVSNGGTGGRGFGGWLSGLWGYNSNVRLGASSTHFAGVYGLEADFTVPTGASVGQKIGTYIVLSSTDTTQGTFDDAGMAFASGGSNTLRMGIDFNPSQSGWAFSGSSTLIGVRGQEFGTITSRAAFAGVDWRAVTFAANGSAFASNGFSVTPTGGVAVGNALLNPTTTGVSLDLSYSKGTSPTVATGGSNWDVNSLAKDQWWNLYRVTGVTGNVATTVALVNGPIYVPTSGASNPLTLTALYTGTGADPTGLTVNLTWTSTSQIKVGSSTADVVVGKGSTGATTDTVGFLMVPFVSGTPTGVPTNASAGVAMRYDTSGNKLWVYNGGWKSATFA